MRFTLVIPVAPEREAEVIKSIEELDYPKCDFYVIVVKGRNPSDNRNRGAERAKGEVIGFLDDDAIVDKSLLKNAENFFDRYPEVDIAGGPQLTPKDERGFAKMSGYALSSRFGSWKVANRYSGTKTLLDVDETALTSANLFCRVEVMKKIKFDVNLFPGEDPDFINRAKKEGFRVAYSPEIIVYHRRRPKISGMMKQMFSYGRTRPAKESIVETLKMPFFLMPSLFLVYLVLLIGSIINPLRITAGVIGVNEGGFFSFSFLWFLPLIAYIFLSLLFGIYDSLKNKDYKAIFILPFIYPILHLSYGAGMIYGYWKKLKRI